MNTAEWEIIREEYYETGPVGSISQVPEIAVQSPHEGDQFHLGERVRIRVLVAAGDIDHVVLEWEAPTGDARLNMRSLGGGAYDASVRLQYETGPGPRHITIVATDRNGHSTSKHISIVVAD